MTILKQRHHDGKWKIPGLKLFGNDWGKCNVYIISLLEFGGRNTARLFFMYFDETRWEVGRR